MELHYSVTQFEPLNTTQTISSERATYKNYKNMIRRKPIQHKIKIGSNPLHDTHDDVEVCM